ncbi:tryptophan synthase beta subunit-like PLP-dependent enzyme [Aspergillus eucalypticola CBS 122712]|uniref:Tryptophan synthase beta subunit-like PLP-dependent enzyme n=1 Tax=Aspergillus eucalypticola (strain CBS 122712 / IBT 29274) TaxID=1448314 RepID=A0A317UPJ8_ASPEC|nr:tryptophan synthase beta subunit-like PLP-dependent enzyme [Aspergillus eucalypticola CBS 122712]PWY63136.1 tryptophan synthase beta subunit-like PLP-dependent enzyme [Aspergillus eucalypticola CBS 122712]
MTVMDARGRDDSAWPSDFGMNRPRVCITKRDRAPLPSHTKTLPSTLEIDLSIFDYGLKKAQCWPGNNGDALPGYETLREELAAQFPGGIDAFCEWPDTRVVVLEPAASPVTTEGRTGSHGVEGIGIGFVPPHLDSKLYDEARGISEAEGRAMCRRLARGEGLVVGTSTGLNVVAAIALAKELGPGKTVVTVAVDTGLKYMNENLLADA